MDRDGRAGGVEFSSLPEPEAEALREQLVEEAYGYYVQLLARIDAAGYDAGDVESPERWRTFLHERSELQSAAMATCDTPAELREFLRREVASLVGGFDGPDESERTEAELEAHYDRLVQIANETEYYFRGAYLDRVHRALDELGPAGDREALREYPALASVVADTVAEYRRIMGRADDP